MCYKSYRSSKLAPWILIVFLEICKIILSYLYNFQQKVSNFCALDKIYDFLISISLIGRAANVQEKDIFEGHVVYFLETPDIKWLSKFTNCAYKIQHTHPKLTPPIFNNTCSLSSFRNSLSENMRLEYFLFLLTNLLRASHGDSFN